MSLIRIRVPSVRPLVRCTFKRVLRVLPSVLLLLFVFSLIFVTLMQIAVIHSRRPQRPLSPPSAPTPRNATSQRPPPAPRRPDTLRVEAFLDRAAPSLDASAALARASAAAARLRRLIDALGGDRTRDEMNTRDALNDVLLKSSRTINALGGETENARDALGGKVKNSRDALGGEIKNSWTRDPLDNELKNSRTKDALGGEVNTNDALNNILKNSWTKDALGGVPRVKVVPSSSEHFFKRERRKAVSCPPVPPALVGRLRVNVTSRPKSLPLGESTYLRQGSSWSSRSCSARHRVALVIPYRDRLEHLHTLLYTLHPLLQRQMLHYSVYVVEQFGNDTFNKGVLMNAGVREALRDEDFHCFVFHDVDMIPEDDRNLYSCPTAPRHLSVAVDKFNYTLPYSLLVGGVFSIRADHFLAVNGYSNLYWGWGGEDDDMAYRIKYRKLEIIRPPETLARYSMIKHEHRPESPNAIRSALLRMAKKRSSRDGLNTAKYRVLWRREMPAYTHLMVDIGRHHRWRFLDNQRLVINF